VSSHWGSLKPDVATCDISKGRSPIDIIAAISVHKAADGQLAVIGVLLKQVMKSLG